MFKFKTIENDIEKKCYCSYECSHYYLNKDNLKKKNHESVKIYNRCIREKKREIRNPVYVFYKNENEIKINVWDKIELLADDQPEKQAKKLDLLIY